MSTSALALLVELVHLVRVLPHHLDEVGHGKVHDVVFPGQLEDHVRVQQVVALGAGGVRWKQVSETRCQVPSARWSGDIVGC